MPNPTQKFPFFLYGSYSGSIAQNATQTISLLIPQGTSFEWHQSMSKTNVDNLTNIRLDTFSVRISDASTQQYYTSDFIPSRFIFGDAQQGEGGLLPVPCIVNGNSTLLFEVKNTQVTALTLVEITLAGIRMQQ